MINFQPVQLSDKKVITAYQRRHRLEGSDGVFGNNYMWREAYKIRWAIIEDSLCITANRGERDFFIPPIGAPDETAFQNAIKQLNEHSRNQGFSPEYRGISNEKKEYFERFFSSEFRLIEDRDNFDYTYLTEDLIHLRGRSYHGKKNHVNQFRRLYPNYEYRTITPEIIPACIDYALEWCRQRGCDSDAGLALERDAIIDCLENFVALDFKGAVIYVNGQIEALTYGEMLNDDTAIIHVEKANGEIKGLYSAINQEFASHAWADTLYINREEDMGEPGLRKAKESYRPIKLIEKYVALSNA